MAFMTPDINTQPPLHGGGDNTQNRTLLITKATNSVDGYIAATDFALFSQAVANLSALTSTVTTQGTTITGHASNLNSINSTISSQSDQITALNNELKNRVKVLYALANPSSTALTSSTETNLINATSSLIPINGLVSGKAFRVRATGIFSSLLNASFTIKLKLKSGATTPVLINLLNNTSGGLSLLTNSGFSLDADIIVASLDVPNNKANLWVQGEMRLASTVIPIRNTNLIQVDSNQTQEFQITGAFGGIGVGNSLTLTNCIIESLNNN